MSGTYVYQGKEAVANRVVYGQTVARLGETDPRIVVLDADISKSTNTFHFAKKFPERFFNMGAAEQNLISVSAGLATMGLVPFASTFAMFACLRASEQVRTSVCYPRLNVKIVATNAGLEIAGDGVTHQATEDLAIMRAIPNLTVVSPSDPVTTEWATEAIAAYNGPVYMRLGRQDARVIHRAGTKFELGRMVELRNGADVAIIATGHMVEQALLAADVLAGRGIRARVLDCHTIKPIDREAIVRAAKETAGIVTAEDHNVIGGLGAAVCEVTAEAAPALVKRVGVNDRFCSSGRDYRKLMAHYGVDAAAIVVKAEEIVQGKRGMG
ncbi:transketolase family protein [Paenibacillus koleovorans]|uniref:transketolase family protein n=1 Tax=Paenibacillus koleovorans TaxID=121608 RepID=UPI000FDB6839|nr:transketolase C-terminal domain-containing protein [Paenibacillus koleovorans]